MSNTIDDAARNVSQESNALRKSRLYSDGINRAMGEITLNDSIRNVRQNVVTDGNRADSVHFSSTSGAQSMLQLNTSLIAELQANPDLAKTMDSNIVIETPTPSVSSLAEQVEQLDSMNEKVNNLATVGFALLESNIALSAMKDSPENRIHPEIRKDEVEIKEGGRNTTENIKSSSYQQEIQSRSKNVLTAEKTSAKTEESIAQEGVKNVESSIADIAVTSTTTVSGSGNDTTSVARDFAELIALIIQTQNETQATLQKSSLGEINAAFQNKLAAAEKEKEAADSTLKAGRRRAIGEMSQAVGSIVGGLTNIIGGTAAKGDDTGLKIVEGLGMASRGLGEGVKAGFDLNATGYEYEANMSKAEAQIYQAEGSYADSMAQRAQSSASSLNQSIQSMVRLLKSFSDTMTSTSNTMAQNIRS